MALLVLAWTLLGCSRSQFRGIDTLPAPVFHEPPTDWPATAPDVTGATDDIEAGWRNLRGNERPWQWIVIHHSGTLGGDARKFDAFHRDPPRNWDELGYHFVIGNGTDSRDGQIEVGPRWIKQKHGAHAATPSHQFNELGIGICLVGDFEQISPTPAQRAAAERLCRFLCRQYGIPGDHIIGHRDAQAAEGVLTTECPGRNMDLPALRRRVEH